MEKNHDICIFSFTKGGSELNKKLVSALSESEQVKGYTYKKFVSEDEVLLNSIECSTDEWLLERFYKVKAIIFIGAIGITVRLISKLLRDKFSDPAIISLDEAGEFVIPILSGHVGGANELSRKISALIGATPVITTATDVRKLWAVDEWAVGNKLAITDRKLAKDISAAVLDNKNIGLFTDYKFDKALPKYIKLNEEQDINVCISTKANQDFTKKPCLRLVPKNIVLGVGCKKDTDVEHMKKSLDTFLAKHNLDKKAIEKLVSIDIKKEEKAITELAKSLGVEFVTFTSEELLQVEGEFTSSSFVKSKVGVDNVCERSAASVYKDIIIRKESYGGITFAASCDLSIEYKI